MGVFPNMPKAAVVIFVNLMPVLEIRVEMVEIAVSENMEVPGVTFDKNLNWKAQVELVGKLIIGRALDSRTKWCRHEENTEVNLYQIMIE